MHSKFHAQKPFVNVTFGLKGNRRKNLNLEAILNESNVLDDERKTSNAAMNAANLKNVAQKIVSQFQCL